MDEGTLSNTKEILDDMHKRKIDMADSIYVINVGGYIGDSAFHVEELKSSATMQAYYHFLKDNGIYIEDVISWFFSEYLRDNYGVADYSFNASSENSGFAERCILQFASGAERERVP